MDDGRREENELIVNLGPCLVSHSRHPYSWVAEVRDSQVEGWSELCNKTYSPY